MYNCLKGRNVRDPGLPLEGLPLRAAKAKALATTERYSRAFQKFREWSSCCEEVDCLPSDGKSVALYLEFIGGFATTGLSLCSALESAVMA